METNDKVGNGNVQEEEVSTQTTPIMASAEDEIFFDKHPTAVIFFGNLIFGQGLTMILFPIVSNFGPSKLLSSLAGLLSMGVFIGSIILGATNYRGKRKEIFKGILYLILVPVVIALVGFGVCMLVILGLGHH